MKTNEPSKTEDIPLSMLFGEEWKAFVQEEMDENIVATIVSNAKPPQNSPHRSTTSGVAQSAREFLTNNGDEFFKAVDILEGR